MAIILKTGLFDARLDIGLSAAKVLQLLPSLAFCFFVALFMVLIPRSLENTSMMSLTLGLSGISSFALIYLVTTLLIIYRSDNVERGNKRFVVATSIERSEAESPYEDLKSGLAFGAIYEVNWRKQLVAALLLFAIYQAWRLIQLTRAHFLSGRFEQVDLFSSTQHIAASVASEGRLSCASTFLQEGGEFNQSPFQSGQNVALLRNGFLRDFTMSVRLMVLASSLLGLIAQSAQAAGDSNTYGYDNNGRLQTVTYANGTVITYTYDPAGNRTQVVTTCSSGGC